MTDLPETSELPNLTEVQSFFYGQCVFLTGVSGLVGKVLLEKLLRCCPGIGMVYVLLRGKKGLTTEERLDKIFSLELFKYMKIALPEYREKVQIIEGDITKPKFGISLEDFQKIQQNVSIVFHSAASINFTEPLRKAAEQNVISVLNLMTMCKEMPQLKALVHLSTIYVKREPDGYVLEEVPKLEVTPFQLLEALQWMNEESEKSVTKMLTGEKVNTYVVTKALAERVILEKKGKLPVAIVRPGYILPTFKEPFEGWIDSLQGVPLIILAGVKGVLRTARFPKGGKFNMIPVDTVINTVITSAWHVGTTKPSSLFIVNCALELEKIPTDESGFVPTLRKAIQKYPSATAIRYPDASAYDSRIPYCIHTIFEHFIVALVVDFWLFIFTGRTILTKTYYKIHVLCDIFYKMTVDLWTPRLDNYKILMKTLSQKDSKIFSMDTEEINFADCMDLTVYGTRKYVAKEDPSSIPYAKKRAHRLLKVTTTLKWIIIVFFLYFLTHYALGKTTEEKNVYNSRLII